MRDISRWIFWNAVATVILVAVVLAIGGIGWWSNHERILDIQSSRIYSCQRNYQASGELTNRAALFFFPPARKRTPRQQALAEGLGDYIRAFVARKVAICKAQTGKSKKPLPKSR